MMICEIMARAKCLCFNGHFSRWTWVSQYQKVSIPDYSGTMDDGGGGDSWSCKTRKSSPCNHQLLQARCPSCRPTNSGTALKGKACA